MKKSLRLIKGGKQKDLTEQVNLKFAELMCQAVYFGKDREIKELNELMLEHDIKHKEHDILLELFESYEHLLALGEVPFSFVDNFKKLMGNVVKYEDTMSASKQ